MPAVRAPVLGFSDSPLTAGAIALALVSDRDAESVLLVTDAAVVGLYATAFPLAAAVVDTDSRARRDLVSMLREHKPLLPVIGIGSRGEPSRDPISGDRHSDALLRLTTRSALLEALSTVSIPNLVPTPADALTSRQADVAHLMSHGLSNTEIAQQLGISVSTVKNHAHAVLQKLHVARRSGLLFALGGQSASEQLHRIDRCARY